jgi:hypothetical protein
MAIIGTLEVVRVSLKFFQQFDKKIKVGVYGKGSKTYDRSMSAPEKVVPRIPCARLLNARPRISSFH